MIHAAEKKDMGTASFLAAQVQTSVHKETVAVFIVGLSVMDTVHPQVAQGQISVHKETVVLFIVCKLRYQCRALHCQGVPCPLNKDGFCPIHCKEDGHGHCKTANCILSGPRFFCEISGFCMLCCAKNKAKCYIHGFVWASDIKELLPDVTVITESVDGKFDTVIFDGGPRGKMVIVDYQLAIAPTLGKINIYRPDGSRNVQRGESTFARPSWR